MKHYTTLGEIELSLSWSRFRLRYYGPLSVIAEFKPKGKTSGSIEGHMLSLCIIIQLLLISCAALRSR
jgi:hypothetical protein